MSGTVTGRGMMATAWICTRVAVLLGIRCYRWFCMLDCHYFFPGEAWPRTSWRHGCGMGHGRGGATVHDAWPGGPQGQEVGGGVPMCANVHGVCSANVVLDVKRSSRSWYHATLLASLMARVGTVLPSHRLLRRHKLAIYCVLVLLKLVPPLLELGLDGGKNFPGRLDKLLIDG